MIWLEKAGLGHPSDVWAEYSLHCAMASCDVVAVLLLASAITIVAGEWYGQALLPQLLHISSAEQWPVTVQQMMPASKPAAFAQLAVH